MALISLDTKYFSDYERFVFGVQGVRFDPDLPQTLRLEFAKSNTKVQKPKQHQQHQLNHQSAAAAALINPAVLAAAAASGQFPNR